MNLVDRVKNICLSPAAEWPVIAGESSSTPDLLRGYVAPLAGVSALAGFIGGSLVGMSLPFVGTYRIPITSGLAAAVFTFVMAIVGVLVISAIINALAPTFGGQKDTGQALKVAVYSFTPAWIAGVLQILPALSILIVLASLYSLYLLYLGLPQLMRCPQEKALGYTAVVVVCAIVLSVAVGLMSATITGIGRVGAGGIAGGGTTFDPDTPLGQLEQLGQQMEQAGREIEDAQQRGDGAAQANAAMNALGTLLGGGARVEPVQLDQLRPFVPETFAGLPRTDSSSERAGMAGIMIARAEARYGSGDRSATLELQDTGGVSGLVGLASWMGVEGEREDASGTERNARVNGRLTHERTSRDGGANEYAVVLAERFVVSASGRGVSVDELRAAVSGLNLSGLEALK